MSLGRVDTKIVDIHLARRTVAALCITYEDHCYRRFQLDQFRQVVPICYRPPRHSTNTGQCAIGAGGVRRKTWTGLCRKS